MTRELVISKNISSYLAKVLKENNSPEIIETCLELISNLADTGNMIFFQVEIYLNEVISYRKGENTIFFKWNL